MGFTNTAAVLQCCTVLKMYDLFQENIPLCMLGHCREQLPLRTIKACFGKVCLRFLSSSFMKSYSEERYCSPEAPCRIDLTFASMCKEALNPYQLSFSAP